jgi:hypothetical protein
MISRKLTAGLLALALGTVATSVPTRNAQAVVGTSTGNIALIVLGGIATATGVVSMGAGLFSNDSEQSSRMLGGGGALFLIGVIVLDSDGSPSLKYPPIDAKTANDCHLTKPEYAAYEENIDETNAAVDGIMADMKAGQNVTIEASKAAWESHSSGLDATTRSAVGKLSFCFVQRAQGA